MSKNIIITRETLFLQITLFLLIAMSIYLSESLFQNQRDSKFNFIQAHHSDVKFELKNSTAIINKSYCAVLKGQSMQPTLFEGNTICFKKYEGEVLHAGQIINYKIKDRDVAHRIKSTLYNDKLFVQGDNNMAEEMINQSEVLGILVAVIYS